jgi:hypothetical protein
LKERFIQLIKDFCSLSGMDVALHILNGGSFVVNNVVFLVAHKEQLDPARIYVRCDFGEIPDNRQADVSRALLEANLDFYDGTGPIFSISSRTGHVLFTYGYRLDDMTAGELRDILAALVDSVMEWQSSHFLDPLPLHRNRRLPGARAMHLSTDKG